MDDCQFTSGLFVGPAYRGKDIVFIFLNISKDFLNFIFLHGEIFEFP